MRKVILNFMDSLGSNFRGLLLKLINKVSDMRPKVFMTILIMFGISALTMAIIFNQWYFITENLGKMTISFNAGMP